MLLAHATHHCVVWVLSVSNGAKLDANLAPTGRAMLARVLLQLVVALSLLPSHVAFTAAPLVTPRSWHAAAARPFSSAARLRGAASVVLMKDQETANPRPHPNLALTLT